MKFNVITLFPEMFKYPSENGVVGKAFAKGLLQLETMNPRKFAHGVHQAVDDRPYGGGDGMIMFAEPLVKALRELEAKGEKGHVVYLSPQGKRWNNQLAKSWAGSSKDSKNYSFITLICGRYGGIDQRVIREFVDEEISIGDYVVSGGELPALILIDSVARFIPSVLGNESSPLEESFGDGLLESPQFTRPYSFEGMDVPKALMSGNHKAIQDWRGQLSLLKTALNRPDLIKECDKSSELSKALIWASNEDVDELDLCGISTSNLESLQEKWKCQK